MKGTLHAAESSCATHNLYLAHGQQAKHANCLFAAKTHTQDPQKNEKSYAHCKHCSHGGGAFAAPPLGERDPRIALCDAAHFSSKTCLQLIWSFAGLHAYLTQSTCDTTRSLHTTQATRSADPKRGISAPPLMFFPLHLQPVVLQQRKIMAQPEIQTKCKCGEAALPVG